MTRQVQDAYIVAATRTPIGKAPRGMFSNTRPDDLLVAAIRSAMAQVPSLDPKAVEDAIIGCALPEAEQGLNVARDCGAAGRPAEHDRRRDDQPLLLIRIERGRDGRRPHPRRRGRRDDRRRHRVDEHGADERQQAFVQRAHLREGRERRHRLRHGPDRREGRRAVEGDTRDAGRVRAARRTRRRSRRRRPVEFTDEMTPIDIVEKFPNLATREVDDQDPHREPRRRPARRYQRRSACQAASGVRRQGQRDRRQQLADIRRRRRADPGVASESLKQFNLTPLARFVSFAVRGVPPEIMGIGPKEAIPAALRDRRHHARTTSAGSS